MESKLQQEIKKRAKKPLLRAVRFRIMPLTVTMLALLFVLKMNDLYIGSRALNEALSVHSAQAADTPTDKPADAKSADAKPADDKKPDAKAADATAPTDAAKSGDSKPADASASTDTKPADASTPAADAKSGDDKKSDDKKSDDKTDDKKDDKKDAKVPEEPKTLGAGKTTIKEIEELKAKQNAPQFTQTELDLLQNLVKRREEIEKREQEFEVKAAVLDATEKRVNDKLAEMKTLQAELDKVVAKYNEHQDAEIRGLVKIYETMKPGDAANIFNELEMPILLEVVDKMSERKVAPVLAGMDPKRARQVTEQLAELRRGRVARQNAAKQDAGTAAPTATPAK